MLLALCMKMADHVGHNAIILSVTLRKGRISFVYPCHAFLYFNVPETHIKRKTLRDNATSVKTSDGEKTCPGTPERILFFGDKINQSEIQSILIFHGY